MTREEAIKYLIHPTITCTFASEELLKQMTAYEMAVSALEQPEIICCKDCVFFEGDNPCGMVDWWNTADDFCSRARRREEGGK